MKTIKSYLKPYFSFPACVYWLMEIMAMVLIYYASEQLELTFIGMVILGIAVNFKWFHIARDELEDVISE